MNFSYLVNLRDLEVEYVLLEKKNNSWTIGRNLDNDIVVNDLRASRYHAVLLKEKNKYFLLDLSSKNGTYLNDKKLKYKFRIFDKAFIKIGRTQLQFNSSSSKMLENYASSCEKIKNIVAIAEQLSIEGKDILFVKGLANRS